MISCPRFHWRFLGLHVPVMLSSHYHPRTIAAVSPTGLLGPSPMGEGREEDLQTSLAPGENRSIAFFQTQIPARKKKGGRKKKGRSLAGRSGAGSPQRGLWANSQQPRPWLDLRVASAFWTPGSPKGGPGGQMQEPHEGVQRGTDILWNQFMGWPQTCPLDSFLLQYYHKFLSVGLLSMGCDTIVSLCVYPWVGRFHHGISRTGTNTLRCLCPLLCPCLSVKGLI